MPLKAFSASSVLSEDWRGLSVVSMQDVADSHAFKVADLIDSVGLWSGGMIYSGIAEPLSLLTHIYIFSHL